MSGLHRTKWSASLLYVVVVSLIYQFWPQRGAAALPLNPGQLAIVDKQGHTMGMCPLRHTTVQADVSGFVARVNVQQEFGNGAKDPIEAIYTFPLPEDAAVDDMTMTIGPRIVKGQIKRREEARQIYEAAKTAGKATALLDQERPNIFTQSVANIMPGQKITVNISYVNLLKYDEGRYEWAFPTVVGPRYVPGGGYTVPGQRGAPGPATAPAGTAATVTDADKITPPITPPGTRAGHDISIKVNLDAGVPIGDITSVLHPITVTRRGPRRAIIELQNQAELPNKDFILRYKVAGQELQTGTIAYAPSGGDGYFTLILQPPLAPPPSAVAPKEMVFVIDQTGSQSGWPIKKAKETMRYCITHLNPGDTFQLIGFNTQVYPCFPAAVPATPENIAKANAFLDPIEGRGGTDILKSVDYALTMPDDPKRLRIVCYMTDGYVGNDMQIIDYIGKHRGRARMFPFGVGNSVNRFLIEGMASEGTGVADYVTLQENGNEAGAKFYRRIAQPLLLNVNVDWGGLPVQDVFPRHIPDVFTAAPIILKGRYTHAAAGDITLSGLLRGQPWSEKIHVVLPEVQSDAGSGMRSAWARDKIQDLQSQGWLEAQHGKSQSDLAEQITAVALEYRLMSQYTSFVAVEEQVVNINGKPRTVDIPVEMPEGVSYTGIFGNELGATTARFVGMASFVGIPAPAGPVGPSGPANPSWAGNAGAGRSAALDNRVTALENRVPVPPRLSGRPSTSARTGAPSHVMTGAGGGPGDGRPSSFSDEDVASGTAAGEKRLAAMAPEQRKAVLERTKLAAPLRSLDATLHREGTNGTLHKPGLPTVDKGQVTIQVWLNALSPDGLAKLKAAGFTVVATLKPGKLLLGTVAVEKLDALIALPAVRYVEPLAEDKPAAR